MIPSIAASGKNGHGVCMSGVPAHRDVIRMADLVQGLRIANREFAETKTGCRITSGACGLDPDALETDDAGFAQRPR